MFVLLIIFVSIDHHERRPMTPHRSPQTRLRIRFTRRIGSGILLHTTLGRFPRSDSSLLDDISLRTWRIGIPAVLLPRQHGTRYFTERNIGSGGWGNGNTVVASRHASGIAPGLGGELGQGVSSSDFL